MILVRITDISEAKQRESQRKQVEDALRKSEEHLRLAMEAAQMGAWSTDLVTGEEIWSDQSQILLGFAPGTFDGRLDTFLTEYILTIEPLFKRRPSKPYKPERKRWSIGLFWMTRRSAGLLQKVGFSTMSQANQCG